MDLAGATRAYNISMGPGDDNYVEGAVTFSDATLR